MIKEQITELQFKVMAEELLKRHKSFMITGKESPIDIVEAFMREKTTKDWRIDEFMIGNIKAKWRTDGKYYTEGPSGEVGLAGSSLESMLDIVIKNGWRIRKVTVISTNKCFVLGDIINCANPTSHLAKMEQPITEFTINPIGNVVAHTRTTNDNGLYIGNIEVVDYSLLTQDLVKIKPGDLVYLIKDDKVSTVCYNIKEHSKDAKLWKSLTRAKDYLARTAPLFSYNDIINGVGSNIDRSKILNDARAKLGFSIF
jgi:hypothetical protein